MRFERPAPPYFKVTPESKIMTRQEGVYWRNNFEFITELSGYLKGQRVLEVFAGNGYLAGLLEASNIDITPTTLFHDMDGHRYGVYHNGILEYEAVEAVLELGAEYDVLAMSWPTTTLQAVQAARLWQQQGPGRDILFIGEATDYSKGHLGGCATDEFFEETCVVKKFESYSGNFIEQACIRRYQPEKI